VLTVLALIVFVLSQAVMRAASSWRAPGWLITAAWVAVPAHEASHVMMQAGAALAARDAWLLPPVISALSAHAPLLAALLLITLLYLSTRSRQPLSPSGGAAS
jgi:hypothetical protein